MLVHVAKFLPCDVCNVFNVPSQKNGNARTPCVVPSQDALAAMIKLIDSTLEASQPEAPIPLILETLIQKSAPTSTSQVSLDIKQDRMDDRAIARHWKYMEEAVMTGLGLAISLVTCNFFGGVACTTHQE